MRLQDIVNQIRLVMPKYTPAFADELNISSIEVTAGVARVVTSAAHFLNDGANISIVNVLTKTGVSGAVKEGNVLTFTTEHAHDLTQGWEEHERIILAGFSNEALNGEQTLVAVPNRFTFKINTSEAAPVLSGGEYLLENRIDGVNGRHSVLVVNENTFDLNIEGALAAGYTGGSVYSAVRIGGAVNIERALEWYTEQAIDDYWLFVTMGDADVSRDRSTYSDALATIGTHNDIRLRLIDGFSVFIFKNVSNDGVGVDAVDFCRHDMLRPLLKTLHGAKFVSGLYVDGDFKSVLTGHAPFMYNKAVYVHEYSFQVSMDITAPDSVENTDTRAFRDIFYTHEISAAPLTVLPINLDDEP